MQKLRGKRILFLSAKAFGIPENIKKMMEKEGAIVDYYDERPKNDFLTKALIRINRNLIGYFINKYHNNIIKETHAVKYDYIFFIKAEAISEHNLKLLLDIHPEAESIVYHWDSIANTHGLIGKLKYFDKKFTFDREDSKKYNINFLPLFYYDEFKAISSNQKEFKYDLMFVGTSHSDRYKLIKNISKQITIWGGKVYNYFFFQGRIMFFRYRLSNPEARKITSKEVHFKPIKYDVLKQLYKDSKIIVDIHHPKQIGLTMRCFETLGAKRKLITTNKDIINYDFYNPNNVLVIDRNNPVIPKEFLDNNYQDISDDIYLKYNLSSWLKTIFS